MGAAKMPNLVSILFAPDFVKETTLSTLSLKSLLRRFLLAVTSLKKHVEGCGRGGENGFGNMSGLLRLC